jgi:PAS domain-containing protein
VAHVELSWTESTVEPLQRTPQWNSVDRWSTVVDNANEPCMVIDSYGNIVAVSDAGSRFLGFASARVAIGACLFDRVLPLLDFTSEGGELSADEIQRIPPILALTSGLLARGVLRIRTAGEITTMDAVSTPLLDNDTVVGSLTFFCVV